MERIGVRVTPLAVNNTSPVYILCTSNDVTLRVLVRMDKQINQLMFGFQSIQSLLLYSLGAVTYSGGLPTELYYNWCQKWDHQVKRVKKT